MKNFKLGGRIRPPINFGGLLPMAVVALVCVMLLKFGKCIGGIVTGFTNSIGLTDSPAVKEVARVITTSGNPFDPNMWKLNTPSELLTVAVADAICKSVYDSVNVWSSSDFDELMSGIKQCRYKTQVSWVVYRFQLKYSVDLLTYLQGGFFYGFTADKIAQVIDYVATLPNGY